MFAVIRPVALPGREVPLPFGSRRVSATGSNERIPGRAVITPVADSSVPRSGSGRVTSSAGVSITFSGAGVREADATADACPFVYSGDDYVIPSSLA